MKNQVQQGDALNVVAPSGGFTSGNAYLVGSIFGVAGATVLAGATGVLWTKGVFALAKTSAQAWSQGDLLYWDTTNKVLTNVAGAGPRVGVATDAAANPSATGNCRLDGFPASTNVPMGAVTAGQRVAVGQFTTVTAADTVVTGLTHVTAVVASLDDNPGDNPEWVSATIGDQAGSPVAGSVIIKTWQNTSGTDPTPVAATTFGKKVNWIAIGS